jgi:hypothetical protein
MLGEIYINKDGDVLDKNLQLCDLDIVYESDFLDQVNNKSKEIESSSDYINELYLYFIMPLFEKLSFLKKEGVDSVKVSGFNNFSWLIAAKLCEVEYSYFQLICYRIVSCILLFYSAISILLISMALPFYILMKYRIGGGTLGGGGKLAVLRSPASYSKMKFLELEGVTFYRDDMVYKDAGLNLYKSNMYSFLMSLLLVPAYSVRDVYFVFVDAKKTIGFSLACVVLKYYIKRIPQKAILEFNLVSLLKSNNFDELYTGNKEDRFALLENRLCHRFGLKGICIPHGLEYSFNMPGGLVGDVFYCNTEYSKIYLEKMYFKDKIQFVYDSDVNFKMLAKLDVKPTNKKIVFFPESLDIAGNIKVVKALSGFGVEFYLKLHVNDCLANYEPFVNGNMIVKDFNDAISGNICIARKSTVLLEALYNNSSSVAILEDPKDRRFVESVFPSLNDENIQKVYDFESLEALLKRL